MTGPPRIVLRRKVDPSADREMLITALRARQASIAPKYFYDAVGCALFAAICELPEYYPTRTERAIFSEFRGEIGVMIGPGSQLVDLGAGDCRKAAAWFDVLAPARYIAIDIAVDELRVALTRMAPRHPAIELTGIVADFVQGLDIDNDLDARAATFFYPGSSIGNFSHAAAQDFLASIARHCATRPGSGLLIGVDMKKSAERLIAAYDDAAGVTAAFNRNVLNHANRIAGANFDPRGFLHRVQYDGPTGRVAMLLESLHAQAVEIDGAAREFAAGESIHTEDSYKYTAEGFAQMLHGAGFAKVAHWQDAARDFAVYYASAAA